MTKSTIIHSWGANGAGKTTTAFTLLPSYLKIIEYVLDFRLSVLGDEKTLPKLFLDQIFSSVVKLAIIS